MPQELLKSILFKVSKDQSLSITVKVYQLKTRCLVKSIPHATSDRVKVK